jgi:hypothetical protein
VFNSIKLPGQGTLKKAGPEFRPFTFPNSTFSISLPGEPKVEELPVKNHPSGLVLQRAVANYGNRTYIAAFGDVPAGEREQVTDGELPPLLEKLNVGALPGLEGTAPKSRTYRRDGQPAVSTDFKTKDGLRVGRIDSFFVGTRMHTVIAIVPPPLKASAEVNQFFASVKTKE